MSVVTKESNSELYNALFPEDENIKEILDIFKKINEEYSLDTELDFENYEIPNIYLKQFLDYITNLRTIEQEYSAILSENAELQNKITNLQEDNVELRNEVKELERMCELYGKSIYNAELTNLQEEVKSANESITWWQNRFNALQKENERLKEKLEEETLNKEIAQGHRKQVQDIELQERKELKDYKSRNKKAIEYNYELQERYCHSALYDDLVASKIYEISEKNIKLLNGGDDNE